MGTFRQETLFGRWCGSVTAGGSKEFLASPSARTMHKESCLTQDAPPPAIWCKAAPSENRLAAIWEDALSPKTSPKVCVQSHLGRRQRLPERPLPRRAFRASERQDNMSYLNSRLATPRIRAIASSCFIGHSFHCWSWAEHGEEFSSLSEIAEE